MVYTFKCPLCGRLHPVTNDEDLSAVICPDNETSQLKQITRDNPNRFTRNEWNRDRYNSKVTDFSNNVQLVGVGRHNSNPKRVKNW